MVDSNPAMAEPEQTKKKQTPRDVLRIVFRHRCLFALATALFAIVALAAIPHVPYFEKKYTGGGRNRSRPSNSPSSTNWPAAPPSNGRLTNSA